MEERKLVVHKNCVSGLDIYVTPTAITAVAFKSNTNPCGFIINRTHSEALAGTCVSDIDAVFVFFSKLTKKKCSLRNNLNLSMRDIYF